MFLFIAIALVAIGIGIAALIQKGFKKVLPILGVTFASVMALITIGLMFIGQNAGY